MIKSPIRYQGSKADQLEYLDLPKKKLFVDVFGGSGVVTMNQTGPRVYNDVNPILVKLMQMIQQEPIALVRELEFWPYAKETWRYCFEHNDDPVCWFIWLYMSHMSAGEGWGKELKGKNSRITGFADLENVIVPASLTLRNVIIRNEDYSTILKEYDSPDTLFYLDPPYENARGPYSKINHETLLELIFQLKATVYVSGYTSQLYLNRKWDEVKVVSKKQKIANRYADQQIDEYLYIKRRVT